MGTQVSENSWIQSRSTSCRVVGENVDASNTSVRPPESLASLVPMPATSLGAEATADYDVAKDNEATTFYKFSSSRSARSHSAQDATVKVRNQATIDQRFILYPLSPVFAPRTIPANVFVCAYAATGLVASDAHANIVLASSSTSDFDITGNPNALLPIYAVTGLANEKMATGNVLNVGHYFLLTTKTASSCTMEMPPDHEPRFVNPAKSPDKTMFEIKVETGFTYPHKKIPFIGLGVPDPFRRDEVICIVAWEAIPGAVYLLLPSNDWYCSRGKSTAGAIIDPTEWASSISFGFDRSGWIYRFAYENNGTIVPIS